jgi:nitroreductase
MDLYKALHNRQSHKSFRPDMPAREVLERVLEAAQWAPSAMNLQPWEFTVMTGKPRDEFVALVSPALTPAWQKAASPAMTPQLEARFCQDLGGAPVVIAVTLVQNPVAHANLANIQSGAAMMQNLLLAAQAEGLGTCWITALSLEKEVLAFLGKKDRQLLAITPVGFPAEEPPLPPQKPRKVGWLGFD